MDQLMLLDVSRDYPTPIPAQIAAGIRDAVATGALSPNDAIPSTRVLAEQLGVSRGSVVTAYDQLEGEGYLLTSQGAPTRIHPDLTVAARMPERTTDAPPRMTPKAQISLKPSPGNAGTIRPVTWRKAWREAAAEPDNSMDKSGEPELRHAVAEHLRLARSMHVSPDQIVVTGGSREGLMCILYALGAALRVGVEDPGHPGLRRVIPLGGHEVVECSTDHEGIVVSELPDTLDALLVTPSHLYPFGGAMPAARRVELLEWAARTETVVIEDDFNTELRYRISPQPALSSLATRADVLTLGTFSTLLSRELAAGYVVASPATAEVLREVRSVLGMPVSSVTQRAIAYLLNDGVARRSSRAVHRGLAQRRKVLNERLVPLINGAELAPGDGADLTVRFDTRNERDEFEQRLLEAGIESGHESALWTNSGDGLVLSFAHLSATDFDLAVEIVTRIV
ncbi:MULTISPECIES: PLP-dependent aminotransferase family protein [Corynebacterium]|nr:MULTISPECIES: PLP-dependent aminotransferase family protein [Corynebacterium]MDK6492479.1 PLP-dependent aminotransferase family protein [Corynebacterium coyleae]MDK8663095.1 PLP-dependent aminotransferase family protein [Corynebacterium coyleae]MDK8705859.1 PLP-dependent aminotransferase family protein [Corynebacterium coyleae]MDK8733054.1 PLP-dependent aminotransferase family protein [Corynebacterium coyleae]MDK8891900.1 PLP-dependent aminotransferase family protein [Corynebacterium coylea